MPGAFERRPVPCGCSSSGPSPAARAPVAPAREAAEGAVGRPQPAAPRAQEVPRQVEARLGVAVQPAPRRGRLRRDHWTGGGDSDGWGDRFGRLDGFGRCNKPEAGVTGLVGQCRESGGSGSGGSATGGSEQRRRARGRAGRRAEGVAVPSAEAAVRRRRSASGRCRAKLPARPRAGRTTAPAKAATSTLRAAASNGASP